MVLIGLILLAAAAVVAVDLIVQNTSDVTIHAFGQTWTLPEYWLVVAGLVATAVGLFGLALIFGTARAGRRARRDRRALERENKRLAKSVPGPNERVVPADEPVETSQPRASSDVHTGAEWVRQPGATAPEPGTPSEPTPQPAPRDPVTGPDPVPPSPPNYAAPTYPQGYPQSGPSYYPPPNADR